MRQVPANSEIFSDISSWIFRRNLEKKAGRTLGFVPTMGALHEGHLSLVRRSKRENDKTLVSIFVNPTQFDDPDDLKNYPRTFERDLEVLRNVGADYILYPESDEIYKDGYKFKVTENELSHRLCGEHRPGHFDGVLTIVLKLLNIASAERAYFGEKDFQQYSLIKAMADAFYIPTEVIACPTVREIDGLAMSSRNTRLSNDERSRAAAFSKILRESKTEDEARQKLEALGFEVDYVTHMMGRKFGAVRIGAVRLIDNVEA
jgi:pantoate--beta-alanine ligase